MERATVTGKFLGEIVDKLYPDFRNAFEQSLPYLNLDKTPTFSNIDIYTLKLPSGELVLIPELWIDKDRITEHGSGGYTITIADCNESELENIVSVIQTMGKTVTNRVQVN